MDFLNVLLTKFQFEIWLLVIHIQVRHFENKNNLLPACMTSVSNQQTGSVAVNGGRGVVRVITGQPPTSNLEYIGYIFYLEVSNNILGQLGLT